MASNRGSGGHPSRRDSGPSPGAARSQTEAKTPPAAPSSALEPSPVRHNLPQIPTMSSHSSRVAISKTSSKGQVAAEATTETPFANVVPLEDVKLPVPLPVPADNPLASLASMVEAKQPPKEEITKTPSPKEPKQKPVPSSLPTPPSESSTSDTSPKAAQGAPSAASQSPPMGIKLRIRRSIHEDGTSQRTSILSAQEAPLTSVTTSQQLAASPLMAQAAHSPAAPTGGVDRPKIGRTKTKGDIKKQLMEKRDKKKLEGQAQSPASTSHSESQDTPPPLQAFPETVPLPLAPSKGKPAEMSPEDLNYPPKWLVGDLMWSKVPGHPWWPSMVSFDPFIGIYTKLHPAPRAKHKPVRSRQYHVQFFGNEGERGWIPESRMLSFEGEEAFQRYAQEKIAQDRKNKAWYEVSARRRKAWMVAVASAQEALPMTRNERKVTFTFTYNIPQLQPKKSAAEKSEKDEVSLFPTTSDGMEILPNGVVRKKRARTAKRAVSEMEAGDGVTPPPKRRRKAALGSPLANKSMAQFVVFCQKRKELVRQENPESTEEQIEDKLKELWGQLDEEQKSKFIPMGSDVQHISEMIPIQASRGEGCVDSVQRSGRVVKLSQKMMDVDEENDLFQTPTPRKRRRSSMSPRPHTAAATATSTSVDDIISGVAAGAEQIKGMLDVMKEEEEPMDIAAPPEGSSEPVLKPKKRGRKKKSESSSQASQSDDASSTTDSINLDLVKKEETPDFEVFRLGNHCPFKKEIICRICEQPGELIACEGACFGHYHLSCLGLPVAPSDAFKCDECVSGNHTCFVCKKSGTDTKRCSSRDCGRFYHEDCIKRFPHTRFENNHFHCPLHVCGTCMANNPKNMKAAKGEV